MPVPVREQILVALKAALTGISGIAGLGVERNRAEAVASFPTLIVIDGPQSASEENTGLADYTLTVDIEGHVQAASGDALGTAINDLYAAVIVTVLAEPRTLGGLAIDVAERSLAIDLDREEGGGPQGAFSLELEVQFSTVPGDPYTVGPG